MDAGLKKQYFKILAEELVPALGCTEPIAIALASAKAREVLGVMPERIVAKCSGNLVKNVKCVIVPNTDDLIGIEASAITGAVGGDCSKGMEVLGGVTKEQILEANNLYKKGICSVELLDTPLNLHLIIEAYAGNDKATVEVKNLHDNITFVSRNGETLYESDEQDGLYYGVLTDRSVLTFDRIYDFAETTPIDELKAVFKAQVEDNMAIAEEGLTGKYGVGIGAALIANDKSVFGKVKAYASAASEARLRSSRSYQLRQRQSGHYRVRSRDRLRRRAGLGRGETLSCARAQQSSYRLPENLYRQTVRVLRRGQRGGGKRQRDNVSCRRNARSDQNDARKRSRQRQRNSLRRSKSLVRRENFGGSRRGDHRTLSRYAQ